MTMLFSTRQFGCTELAQRAKPLQSAAAGRHRTTPQAW